MKENGAIGEKTEDPGTSRSVYAKRCQHSNHDLRLDVIEEARKIKEENTANAIGGDAVPGLKTKESGGIRSREEFAGAELSWAQKIMAKIKGTETSGNDFLKKFAMTFEERDRAVSFGKRVIGFLRFGNDHDFCFAPRVEMKA